MEETEENRQRRHGGLPEARGLYSPENEHDACGVGLVADLNNLPSHEVVLDGLTVLKRLMHRGASGGDAETGDGAGLLLALPEAFFRKLHPELPPRGQYGVAMIFDGKGREANIEEIIRSEHGVPLRWRNVPCHPEKIGRAARESCPLIRQLFIDGTGFSSQAEFERKLYVTIRQWKRVSN